MLLKYCTEHSAEHAGAYRNLHMGRGKHAANFMYAYVSIKGLAMENTVANIKTFTGLQSAHASFDNNLPLMFSLCEDGHQWLLKLHLQDEVALG